MNIFHLIFKQRISSKNIEEKLMDDPFNEIGQLIKKSREEQNLSIRELSNISKIPFSTIDAIENNIEEIRPKYPFTRSILLKLEECLYLKKYQLTSLAKKEKFIQNEYKPKNLVLKNLDLLHSRYGNILYLILLIISIFILNNYYLRTRIIEFEFIDRDTTSLKENVK